MKEFFNKATGVVTDSLKATRAAVAEKAGEAAQQCQNVAFNVERSALAVRDGVIDTSSRVVGELQRS